MWRLYESWESAGRMGGKSLNLERLEKIVTLQNYMKKIDNGWNSGQIQMIEEILGELIKEYNEVHNSRIETEEKIVRTRS